MTEETKTNPVVMAGDLITRPGLYEARCGHIVPISGWDNGWWVSECDGVVDWFSSDGLQRCRANTDVGQWDLVRWVAPLPASEAEPETTTEQLAEIEAQPECTPATEYTPPEGWRVLAVGEVLQDGDVTVGRDGSQYPTERKGGWVDANQRYIRPIEQRPQAEQDPEPIQVREGRWRTRGGEVKNIRPCEPLQGAHFVWPWTDGFMTFQDNGRHQGSKESPNDLVEYLGPIEPEPEQVNDWPSVRDLRHELKTVQTQLGESRQRVTQLEELVASLRTINVTQEKAFTAAGKENTALRNQLAAVKAELASVAADRQQLRVELDAAQQVPADSPELRQLRADLEQMTLGRDTYRDGYERVLSDLKTIRETAKAEAVEAIAEWLEPIRLVDSAYLANATMQHLPQIMRHLTGLDSHAID